MATVKDAQPSEDVTITDDVKRALRDELIGPHGPRFSAVDDEHAHLERRGWI